MFTKRNKKSFIALALFASLCISLISFDPMLAKASMNSDADEILSTDDVIEAIRGEYSKYGIDVQVQDQSSAQQVTQQMLDKYIKDIDNQLNASPETTYNDTVQIIVDGNSVLRNSTKKCTATAQVSNSHGYASIKVTASITYSGNTFVKCNSLTSAQSGNAIDFESWTQTSYSRDTLISTLPGRTRYNVNGTLKTSFSIAGIKFTSTTDESFGVEFVYN